MSKEHETQAKAMAQLACDWYNSDPRGCHEDVITHGPAAAVRNWLQVIIGHRDFGGLWSPEGVLALMKLAEKLNSDLASLDYAWVAHLPGEHKADIEDSALYIMRHLNDAIADREEAEVIERAERESLMRLARTLDRAIAASWSPEEIAAAKDARRDEEDGE